MVAKTKVEQAIAKIDSKSLLPAEAGFMDGSIAFTGPYSNAANSNYFVGDSIEALLEWTGNSPEKLVLPKEYHRIVKLCYDFYQRGGLASTVINRLTEFSITDIRNGERKTGEEATNYYHALLHRRPSQIMRFLRFACLEYFLSGMVLPIVEWEDIQGKDFSPKLIANKTYKVPRFDLYPPELVSVVWSGWGRKKYLLKIPNEDIKLIRNGPSGNGAQIKEQQIRYNLWTTYYPVFVDQIKAGNNQVEIEVDPIMRKEVTFNAYPTPYLYNALETLLFKQQLKRMDFSVAARVINAILLVKEGNDSFPLTEDTRANLDALKTQIMARTGNPRLLERLFILFSNHTTTLEWIAPDVQAMLNQDKYKQANDELAQALGFTEILVTGESRNAQASELSTWAIKPMMEEIRSMFVEWLFSVYEDAAELNGFRNIPDPAFKPIQLQDFVKTAAVMAQVYKEGNMSKTTRDELVGLDFETEQEEMLKEKELIAELNQGPPFQDMPYNIELPNGGIFGGMGGRPAGANKGGRPTGSQNVPVNRRNSGVKPRGQKPLSQVKAEQIDLASDEDVIELLDDVATKLGIYVDKEKLNEENTPEND